MKIEKGMGVEGELGVGSWELGQCCPDDHGGRIKYKD